MSATVSVKLYNNLSDPLVVKKDIAFKEEVFCQFTEGTPIDAPELLLDMKSDIPDYNYCYIEEFGRYYFCYPQIVNGNQIRIICESDPLSSFWDAGISNSECIAERSSSNYNPEIADPLVTFKPIPKRSVRSMGNAFTPSASGGSYILTVGGK